MKKKIFMVTAILISSHFGNSLHAQDTTSRTLDPVVLSPGKFPQRQSQTGKVITVINRLQIERSAGKSVAELLNSIAGVTIPGVTNARGTNLTASIRGSSAGNVLILVDGVPINDPSVNTNYFDLNLVDLENVERIEVLKGGQSTLYGSDAVAGVINIVSRQSANKKIQLNGDISGGSYNTIKQNIGFSGNNKGVGYFLNYSHLGSDGFSSAYDNNMGSFDRDGIEQNNINGRIIFKASQRLQLNLYGNFNKYKTDLDAAAFTDEKDYTVDNKNVQAGTGLVYSGRGSTFHFNYNYNEVERDYLDDSTYKSNPYVIYSKGSYIGRTHFAEVYDHWKKGNWELLAGVDFRRNSTMQSYFSTGAFGPYTPPDLHVHMVQISPYASIVYHDGKGFALEAGGRWNHHSEYGNNFSFTFNPSVLLQNKTKLFLNLYTAYKTPTLYQLFDPAAGNKKLEPEVGIVSEAGLSIREGNQLSMRVVGFYRSIEHVILYTYNPSTYASQYINAARQRNYGAECELDWQKNIVDLSANYTYTDGNTKAGFDGTGVPVSKDTTYYNLYRIPKHAFNLRLGLQCTKKFFTAFQLRAVSSRQEFIFGSAPETLNGYATVGLYAEYKFKPWGRVYLDLKNLTNEKYFDFLGYNAARMNWMGGVRVTL